MKNKGLIALLTVLFLAFLSIEYGAAQSNILLKVSLELSGGLKAGIAGAGFGIISSSFVAKVRYTFSKSPKNTEGQFFF